MEEQRALQRRALELHLYDEAQDLPGLREFSLNNQQI
jgi:hypothetical protein